jgi:hypothetical protein
MRIPRRKGGAGPLAVGVPSRRAQVAAVFALAALLGVSVLYDSAHIAASLRRHGAGPRAYAKLASDDGAAAAAVSSASAARVSAHCSCSLLLTFSRSVGRFGRLLAALSWTYLVLVFLPFFEEAGFCSCVQEEAPAVEEETARAPPAKGVESAPVEGTDRPDPPPHQQQAEKADTEAEAVAKPGATAGSSLQDAPLIEEVVQGGGAVHDGGGAGVARQEGACDLYRGRWVYDEARAPLYKESGCGFLTEQVTCMRNGRRDDDYQKWRWQPDGCDLPRYVAAAASTLASLLACHSATAFPPLSLFPFLQLPYTCISIRIRVRAYGPASVVQWLVRCVRAFVRGLESGGGRVLLMGGCVRPDHFALSFLFESRRQLSGSVSASEGLQGSFGLIFLVRSVWTW